VGCDGSKPVVSAGFFKPTKCFGDLQTTVGVLQATTAVIGVGTTAGVALSAVNLHQTLKLEARRKATAGWRLKTVSIDLK